MLEGRGGVILKERQLKTLAKMERSNYDAVLKLKFFFNVSSTTPPTPLHASSCSCRNLQGQWGSSFWGWLVGLGGRSVDRSADQSFGQSVGRSVSR